MSGTGHINIPDSTGASNNRLRLGSSSDFQIYHDSQHSWIRDLATGNIYLDTNGDRVSIISDGSESTGSMAKFHKDGAVQLFYDGSRRFQTQAEGVEVYGAEGGNAVVYLFADEGDDNTDKIRLLAGDGTGFYLQNKGTGSWVTNLKAAHNGNVELYHQGSKMFETTSTGVKISNGNRVLNIKQGTNSNYINLAAESTSGSDAYMDINSYGLAIKTGGNNRLQIANDGTVTVNQNLDALGGIDVTGISNLNGNVTVDSGSSTLLNVKCDNDGNAIVRAGGDAQGTGALEVSQDNGQNGGGFSYNGDASPAFVSGEQGDHITFYRIASGTRTEVFHYPYNSSVVNFNSVPTVGGVSLVRTSDTVANATEAANVTAVANNSTNASYRIPFLSAATGTAQVQTDSVGGPSYNPSTGRLFSGSFQGDLVGDCDW